jgi:hypothetical protein
MHTVEVLEEALAAARRLGYHIRQEGLMGAGGGPCEFQGKRWIFLDLGQSPAEQLEEVLTAIGRDRRLNSLRISPALRKLCVRRRAA